ncbi:MAG: class I SAM-dependent methyltransferase, partial [Halanaerobiaceae bacterium]|nr:class I SAM-dependent methyltransferase [Halanaerobiaceae bacterium]
GNALKLEDYETEKYDVILLMGPLYHLVDERDRKSVVEGSLRLLKPDGIIFASFISNYAPLQDNLKNLYPIDDVDVLLGYLKDGVNEGDGGFTTAYFSSSREARDLMNSFGLQELVFVGIENILAAKEIEINQLEKSEYRKWLEICYRLGQDDNLIGTSEHFLYIGQK